MPTQSLLRVALAAAAARVGGCGASSSPRTIHVPGDARTIQAAVDEAEPGDRVLIEPGVYREEVTVRTPRVVIRGVDRNRVILDGEDRRINGIVANADGVAVENLTTRRYTFNGVLFTGSQLSGDSEQDHAQADAPGVRGFRASYVTAYNNGLYGIYAFAARGGRIDHTYTSGHPDSGLYIGQCKPCDVLVTDSVAELNAVGFEGTNASGVTVVRSTFRRNRVGVTLSTQNIERLAPQEHGTIAGNLVVDNRDPRAPATARGAFGIGIAVGGGVDDTVVRNRVVGHTHAGIAVTDLGTFVPEAVTVRDNVVDDSGTADLVYAFTERPGLSGERNCFAGNRHSSSLPAGIERRLPCHRPSTAALPAVRLRYGKAPQPTDYRRLPAPPPQPNMPDAATAPARPAVDMPGAVDLDSIQLPPEEGR